MKNKIVNQKKQINEVTNTGSKDSKLNEWKNCVGYTIDYFP